MIDVSVILPALFPNDDFMRCVQSIKAALCGRVTFEIICVVPQVDLFADLKDCDLLIIQEGSPSIYGAMNTGVKIAAGNYLYFIGQDDILLPAAADAITQGIKGSADLIIADVYWGNQRIFVNRASRTILVWKNWCHQGIFYGRMKFIKEVGAFPTEYKVQADHYVNIVFSNVVLLRQEKFEGCVSWYSSKGFSTSFVDVEFRKIFPQIVRENFGLLYFFVVVARRTALKILKVLSGRK